MIPSLSEYDAVSTDLLIFYHYALKNGMDVDIYAQFSLEYQTYMTTSLTDARRLLADPTTTVVYHHCVLWTQGEELLRGAKAKILMKYHNITPADFFHKYDPISAHATALGAAQTKRLIQDRIFTKYLVDSDYNGADLEGLGADPKDIVTIAPMHRLDDFKGARACTVVVAQELQKPRINVLFVGRVVPNKGHLYLIRTIAHYKKMYGSAIRLNIVGDLSPNFRAYGEELRQEVIRCDVVEEVRFVAQVNFEQLVAYYLTSHVFLLLSEHEGFCVPILEAQSHLLPIVALNRTAVAETLGEGQIITNEIDYFFLASAVHKIATDLKLRLKLAENGRDNLKRFSNTALIQKTLEVLHGV
jgi:glycosyltransferase involved in cell wall biosynthesis